MEKVRFALSDGQEVTAEVQDAVTLDRLARRLDLEHPYLARAFRMLSPGETMTFDDDQARALLGVLETWAAEPVRPGVEPIGGFKSLIEPLRSAVAEEET